MTSEEVKNASLSDTGNGFWLKEIAYQLAVMNERPRCSNCLDTSSRMPQAMLNAETQKGQTR